MTRGRKGGNGKEEKEKNDGNSGHYIVASQLTNSNQLQRRRLFQI